MNSNDSDRVARDLLARVDIAVRLMDEDGVWREALTQLSANDSALTKKRRIGNQWTVDLKGVVVANLSQLYLSDRMSDVCLKVGDHSIPAHKSLLASHSDFFDRLFASPMIESSQSTIELKQTDPRLFRLLLKLIYFGQISFEEITSQDLVKVFSNSTLSQVITIF